MIYGKTKISRKEFLNRISWLIALPFLVVGGISIKRHKSLKQKSVVRLPLSIRQGVTFQDNIIVVKEKNRIRFLSSKCTHLGCKINSFENNEFTCPCHGSTFAINGKSTKGPAAEPLKELAFSVDNKSGEYIVKL